VRATVKGVELVKAGKWNGLNGPVELTEADLADAVAASKDPEVDHAVLKLGHIDPRFDGQPAAGWVENLRLSDDKRSLIGDLVDMPRQLADLLSDAFRRRSAELRRDVKTPSGKRYRAVLSGLALLGVQPPAVKGLSDVLQQYASEGTPGHEDEATQQRIEALELSDGDTPPVPHDQQQQNDSGHVQAPQGAQQTPAGEGDDMDPKIKAAIVKRLGLKADATDAEVMAALEAEPTNDGQQQQEQPGEQNGGNGGEQQQTQQPAGEAQAGEAQAGQAQAASEGTVTVPRSAWDSLQQQVKTLSEAEQKRANDALLQTALSEGKITPAEVNGWREGLEDSQRRPGTVALLSNLPQRVAVIELGDGSAAPAGQFDEKAWAEQADALGL